MPYGLLEQDGRDERVLGTGESVDLPLAQETQFCNRILIQYRYEGSEVATLRLRPLIGDRDFHHQQSATEELHFSQVVGYQQIYLQGSRAGQVGMPWQLRWSAGHYQPEGVWYWDYYYPEERRRGLGDKEDLYSPGYLSVLLHPGESVTLEARVGGSESAQPELNSQSFEQALQTEQERQSQLYALAPVAVESERESIWRQLLRAGDQFITPGSTTGDAIR
jgi:4-alpha-glucanotransferase